MNNTKICIIRHGETDWNKYGRIQGQLNIPLNGTGRAQASAMASNAAHYEFDALYCSDLDRAVDTAKALAQLRPYKIKTLKQLRERHFGVFQGLYKKEVPELFPEDFLLYQARDVNFKFETGESLIELNKRVLAIFNELIGRHRNQQIAVVCHAGPLDIMYRHANNKPLDIKRDFDIPNSALNWFYHDGNEWHVTKWDDHHHVKQVIKTPVE